MTFPILNSKHGYNGYVVYGQDNHQTIPIGVISDDDKIKAFQLKSSINLERGLIAIEDRRFYDHCGVDFKSIVRALLNNIKAGRIVEGGSTITQQLARNLMSDFRKSLFRKIKESAYSIFLEENYSKQEIIDLYFGNIYWGKNLYGLRSASLYYFSKEPFELTNQEEIMLLSLLRGPNLYSANSSMLLNRYKLLNKVLYHENVINRKKFIRNMTVMPQFRTSTLTVFHESLIKYISKDISSRNGIIHSSINVQLQRQLNSFVKKAPFRISIVVISKDKVCAISGSEGIGFPILFKTNVGSTLKPFLYEFYRRKGIDAEESFCAHQNSLRWHVKEATYIKDWCISLKEALLYSNNNVFINAAIRVGLDETLDFISELLHVDRSKLFPSSILGATSCGISLIDLAFLYYNHFTKGDDPLLLETLSLLKENARNRLSDSYVNDIYLKTGTTNGARECYAILGNQDKVMAFMRNGADALCACKDASMIEYIKGNNSILDLLKPKNEYKWI